MREVENRTIILSVKGGTCKSPAAVRIGIREWVSLLVGRTSLRSLPGHRAWGKAEKALLLVSPLRIRAVTIGLDAAVIVGISTIFSTPSPLGRGSVVAVVTAPFDLLVSLSVLEPVHGVFDGKELLLVADLRTNQVRRCRLLSARLSYHTRRLVEMNVIQIDEGHCGTQQAQKPGRGQTDRPFRLGGLNSKLKANE